MGKTKQPTISHKIFNINLGLYSYFNIRTSVNEAKSKFLIDTWADISVIKICQVLNEQINSEIIYNLSEVGPGLLPTLGKIYTDLKTFNLLKGHEFHVVEDGFSIPFVGIIGMDFIRKYNYILDFSGNDTIIVIWVPNFHEQFARTL